MDRQRASLDFRRIFGLLQVVTSQRHRFLVVGQFGIGLDLGMFQMAR